MAAKEIRLKLRKEEILALMVESNDELYSDLPVTSEGGPDMSKISLTIADINDADAALVVAYFDPRGDQP